MDRRAFLTATGALCAGTRAVSGARAEEAANPTEYTVTVDSWDGTPLVADLYVPGDGEGPYPSLVFMHGSGGNRSDYRPEALAAARAGYVALAPDMRGFGDSGGEWSVNGPKEVADVLVHVDALADGTFRRQSGETVSVPVTPSSNGPTVGLRGASIGGAIQLQTAAATLDWFRSLEDLRIAPVEERLESLPGPTPDSPTAYEGEVPDADALDAATPNLDLTTSPLDAIVPRIPWWRVRRAVAPNDVIKGAWFTFLNIPNGPPGDDGVPALWRQAFVTLTTARNEMPPSADAFFERRTPDLDAIAANDVPTLIVDEWNDGYIPPRHGLKLFRGLRAAGTGVGSPPVALAIAPLDRPKAHNWEYPLQQDAAENERVTSYLDAITRAWTERFLKGDASAWYRNRDWFDGVSIYQRQYPDVPARYDDDRWPGWRSLETFPPAAATPTALPLSAARPTDRTVLVNTVAQSSFRGPTGTFYASPHADAPASSATFDFAATAPVDVTATPRLRLTVTPLGPDAVVFAKFRLVEAGAATGPVIDSQVMPYRLRDAAGERTTIEFDLVPFQRYLSPGDRLRVVLSTTDNAYYNSRENAGLVVHHASPDESVMTVETAAGDDALEGRPGAVDRP